MYTDARTPCGHVIHESVQTYYEKVSRTFDNAYAAAARGKTRLETFRIVRLGPSLRSSSLSSSYTTTASVLSCAYACTAYVVRVQPASASGVRSERVLALLSG